MKQTSKSNTNQPANAPFLEVLKQRTLNQPSSEHGSIGTSLENFRQQKEIEKRRVEQFHQTRNKEWSQVYSAKEKDVENRLSVLRQQIKQLSKQLKRLDSSTQTAIQSEPIRVGEYHLSFLEQLQEKLKSLSQKVAEANTWLSLYNQRSKKKSYYWGQFSKKGSSFSLNQERQLATSVN